VIIVLIIGLLATNKISDKKKISDRTACKPFKSKKVSNAKDYIYMSNKCVANTCVDGYILDTTENTCTLDCKNIITDLSNDEQKKECYPECYTSDGSLLDDEGVLDENKVKCGIETAECYGKTLDNIGSIESAKECGLISKDKDNKCLREEGDKVVTKTLKQLITVNDTETAKLCYPSVSDKIGNNCYKPDDNNNYIVKTANDFPLNMGGLEAARDCGLRRGALYCYDETKKGFPKRPVGNFLTNLDAMDTCHPGERRKITKRWSCYNRDSERIELNPLSHYNIDNETDWATLAYNEHEAFECGYTDPSNFRCHKVVNGQLVDFKTAEYRNRKDSVDCDWLKWKKPYDCFHNTTPYGPTWKPGCSYMNGTFRTEW
tara:strand:- start:235 stop:1359 length:1125 start_codon:yes stop_codon:yes gene_type:complete